jgi:hypothetical protein
MPDMTDLIEFLLCRISEDEEIAAAARGELIMTPSDLTPYLDRFAASRALAECAAKRRIVALHSPVEGTSATVCEECGPEEDVKFQVRHYGRGFPCRTLRLLALPHADHEAYRPEWAP